MVVSSVSLPSSTHYSKWVPQSFSILIKFIGDNHTHILPKFKICPVKTFIVLNFIRKET